MLKKSCQTRKTPNDKKNSPALFEYGSSISSSLGLLLTLLGLGAYIATCCAGVWWELHVIMHKWFLDLMFRINVTNTFHNHF